MPEASNDRVRLRQTLDELAGCEDDAFAADMLEAFLDSAAASAAQLAAAGDLHEVARVAHRFKSSFATLGLADGARACALLEVAALDGDLEKVALARQLVDEARREAEALARAVLGALGPLDGRA